MNTQAGMPEDAADELSGGTGLAQDRRTPHVEDRRAPRAVDRRAAGPDDSDLGESDRRSQLDRRRGPGRRRTDSRVAAEEGHMNEDQLQFLMSIDEYKRVNQRPFPTLTEVLDVLMYLGYRKVAPVGEFKMRKGRQTPLPGNRPIEDDLPPD